MPKSFPESFFAAELLAKTIWKSMCFYRLCLIITARKKFQLVNGASSYTACSDVLPASLDSRIEGGEKYLA